MKHGRLCSIGHNLADSIASGISFIVGIYQIDVFGEAAASSDGVIELDFLRGKIVRGDASDSLQDAAARFAAALPGFCEKHDANVAEFEKLTAEFRGQGPERRVTLHVTDSEGISSLTEYRGVPLKRLRVLDDLGRVRKLPRTTSQL